VWVEDLGSTNGTFVNGERIDARTLVRAGDAVRIGQTELRLER
jgi:pSer/pThr/pTyr-binding forkhead associated (FHA) protein